MRGGLSASTGHRYPLTMICTIPRVAGSSVYATRTPARLADRPRRQGGPKTIHGIVQVDKPEQLLDRGSLDSRARGCRIVCRGFIFVFLAELDGLPYFQSLR